MNRWFLKAMWSLAQSGMKLWMKLWFPDVSMGSFVEDMVQEGVSACWFVSHRHLACVHIQACRFRQMALTFKHGFLDSSVSKLWKGTCGCSAFTCVFWLFFFLHLSLVNKSFQFLLQNFPCVHFFELHLSPALFSPLSLDLWVSSRLIFYLLKILLWSKTVGKSKAL